MLEAAIAIALLSYLTLLGVLGIESLLVVGAAATLAGLLGGGGAGIVYHLVLRQSLTRLGASTQGWLWSPVSCHRLLDEKARGEVLPWFRVGAAGFLVCVAGIGMVAVAAVKAALVG